jgi:hypothetical protein
MSEARPLDFLPPRFRFCLVATVQHISIGGRLGLRLDLEFTVGFRVANFGDR